MDVPINTIFYYLREGLWAHCKNYCAEEYKRVNDPSYLFWKAYASYKDGNPNQAINDLNTIKSKKEIQYAVTVALIFYHNQCQNVDRDAISYLSSSEDSIRRTSGDKSFILLAYFNMFNNEIRDAERFLDMTSGTGTEAICAKGWLELAQNEDDSIARGMEIFESILGGEMGGDANLTALMGKVKASELLKKFPITVDTINEVIVMYPTFHLAQAEKSKVLMMICDWEQFLEVTQRMLAQDERSLFGLQAYVFYLLAQDGNLELGVEKLKQLATVLDKAEPNNPDLCYKCAQLFSRISGRDPDVLKITLGLVEKALKLRPLEADFAVEKAYHLLMMGDIQGASNQYQEAAALDEGKIEPLTGMIQCRLLQGMIDDAEQQIEFVNEIQVSVGKTPEMAFLEAMLNTRRPNMPLDTKITTVIRYLDDALKLQISQTKALNQDYGFYIKLNPDFLLSLSREYFQFLTLDLTKKVEVVPEHVRKGNRLLEIIRKQIPGLLPAHLLLAKGKIGAGDTEAALRHIEKVIEMNSRHEEANILYALVSFNSGNARNAKSALEEAIANNFQIRENPLFLMIKGEIELNNGDNEAALATLESAFNLPIVKSGKPGRGKKNDTKNANQLLPFTEKERCKIHVLLAKAYIVNSRVKDAKNIMDEAIKNFSGTSEEGTVLLTNAELSVAAGDIKKALSILKAVDKDSQYFISAKKLMADIYLNNLLDRRHYAQCYIDLIEVHPTYENFKLLGQAFMAIQEPEDAAQAYKKALELNPDDKELVRLIGNALIATHDYNQAMNYYEETLKNDPDHLDLKLDLGKLCIQLKRFPMASQYLKFEIFSDEFGAGTVQALKRNVDGLLSIAKLNIKKEGKTENPIANMKEIYQKAISMQGNVIEATKQAGGNAEEERKILSDINYEFGRYLSHYEKNYAKAMEYFEAAFKYNQASEKILSSMAEMHIKQGDLEGAEMRAIQVLKLNPFHQYACFLIADLMIIKGESQKAIKQFMRVLEFRSGDHELVSRLVELMYRTGKLEEVNEILEKIQKQCPNPNDPGLCYCKGLYHKYTKNPQEALKEFFKAKRSSRFAEDSIAQMIDIYLNPDQDIMYSAIGDGGVKQVEAEYLRAAENLVKELKSRGTGIKGQVSEAQVLMFQKGKLDTAIKKLTEILSKSPDHVPAIAALGLARMIQGKKEEAKKILYSTTQKIFSLEYAEELERSWLILADDAIQSNDLNTAEGILNECLKFNNSCGKAAEYLGLIREKQKRLDLATASYEHAWKLTMERSPSIGYRLSFNYLKSRRYVECIEICKKILDTYPDFQKIDKDVYQRAKNAIRQ